MSLLTLPHPSTTARRPVATRAHRTAAPAARRTSTALAVHSGPSAVRTQLATVLRTAVAIVAAPLYVPLAVLAAALDRRWEAQHEDVPAYLPLGGPAHHA